MNGRQEIDIQIENRIKEIIKISPLIVEDFYYSLSDKTPRTKKAYVQHVKRFLDFISYDNDVNIFKDMRTSTVNKFFENVKYNSKHDEHSKSWMSNIYFGISSFFDFLVNDRYIDTNICKNIKPPKNNDERYISILTKENIHDIEEAIRCSKRKKWINRDMAIFLLGCGTGIRVSAISGINIDDIDFDNKTVTVIEKGNKKRSCLIPDKAVYAIRKWIEDRTKLNLENVDALFVSQKKCRLSVSAIEDMFIKYSMVIGKHITPHVMRHTVGTNVYEATGDVKQAADVLGHKNIQNTINFYVRTSEQKRKEAAQILNGMI